LVCDFDREKNNSYRRNCK